MWLAPARRGEADEGRQPHVRVAAHREHRAERGKPDEQRRGELVRPYQRPVKEGARDDPDERPPPLERQERGGGQRDRNPQRLLAPPDPGKERAPRWRRDRRRALLGT